MDWSASSPDANPIENVWTYIKMKFRRKRIFKQLRIRKIWLFASEYAENVVQSMEKDAKP